MDGAYSILQERTSARVDDAQEITIEPLKDSDRQADPSSLAQTRRLVAGSLKPVLLAITYVMNVRTRRGREL